MMNLADIYSPYIGTEIYTKALDILKKKCVVFANQNKTPDETLIKSQVIDKALYFPVITVKHDNTFSFGCSCNEINENENHICSHIVAVAIYSDKKFNSNINIQESFQTNNIKTSSNIRNYMTTLEQDDFAIENSSDKVYLSPFFDFIENEILVRFKIGNEKKYYIRDISAFINAFERKENIQYGAKLTFTHSLDNIHSSSRPLLDIIFDGKFSNATGIDPSHISLTSNQIDKIFNLFATQDVILDREAFVNSMSFVSVKFKVGNPKIEMTLEKKGFQYELSAVNMSELKFYYGITNTYALENNNFYQTTPAYSRFVKPFRTYVLNNSMKNVIAQEDLTEFLSSYTNYLSKFIKLKYVNFDPEQYKPSKLFAEIYFDVTDGIIVGKPVTYYLVNNQKENIIFSEACTNLELNRDYQREKQCEKLLLDIFHSKTKIELRTDKEIYDFLTTYVDTLEKKFDLFISEKVKEIKIREPKNIKLSVNVNTERLIDLDITDDEFSKEELNEIMTALHMKKNYIRLKNGTFVNTLCFDKLEEIEEKLNVSIQDIMNKKIKIPMFRAPLLDDILKENSELNYERDFMFKNIVRDINNSENANYPIPKSLKDILRPYQKTGYRWLRTLCTYKFGGILADDMGLGKTLQIIALIMSLSDRSKPSLIITPSSLVLNWRNEFLKFAPHMKVLPVYGTAEERERLIESSHDCDVIITSYELIRRDIEFYQNIDFLINVIDEAQYIKNHTTKNATTVKGIHSEYRFALSGTPIENNLAELWSIFDFVMPGYLYSYNFFRNNYEIGIVKNEDEGLTEKLQKLIKPFILRRLKSSVLKELPALVETLMTAPLENDQKKSYHASLAEAKLAIAKHEDINSFSAQAEILQLLSRLRQICCSPEILFENYKGNSAKLQLCLELIEENTKNKQKILLFSNFTRMLDIIANKLDDRNITYYRLQGNTPTKDRVTLVDNFNSDTTQVFLISLKAGGTGLNLTGANVVIMYDPWWNLSAENQAIARAHRIGQRNGVQVYKLIVKDTIEEKIVDMQLRKKELFDTFIKEGESFVSKMSKDDLLELLND